MKISMNFISDHLIIMPCTLEKISFQ